MIHSVLCSRRVRLSLALLLLLLIQAACAPAAAPPQPTSTPAPTDPPPPSATPTLTSTPTTTATFTPTATPNYLATQYAKGTATMQAKIDTISPVLATLSIPAGSGNLAWYAEKPILVTVNNYNSFGYQKIDSDKVGDFVLHSEIIWDSTSGLAGCGIILRSEGNLETGKYIRFWVMRLQNAPAWEMFYVNHHYVEKYLTHYKFDSIINDGKDSKNVIDLVVHGNQFTPYINGEKKVTLENNDLLSKGDIFVIANQESGSTSCNFQNAWIWSLD